jgi:hypothetical protein
MNSNTQEGFEQFRGTFLANIRLRSRTAKGKVNTGISTLKLPLLVDGEELQAQLQLNLLKTARLLYSAIAMEHQIGPDQCKHMFNVWFDRLQEGLIDTWGYKQKREELGLPFFNLRYRIWDVNYDPTCPKPTEIEHQMDNFCIELAARMQSTAILTDRKAFAGLLAFADRELDRIIHPWLDGCGRFATAVVMWLAARVPDMPYPVFGQRDEHYAAMKTEESHTEYFMRCLSHE